MVSSTEIKPALALQPYVSCYGLRTFSTGEIAMPKPFHAVHEYYATFFLKEKFCELRDDNGKFVKRLSNSLTTFFTESQGCTYWKGDYSLFHMVLKCNGLFAIFGIPQKILINTVIPLEDLIVKDYKILADQIESAKDIFEMGKIMDAYLLRMLLSQKHKIYTPTIAHVSNTIVKSGGLVMMDALASISNMSFRNFERRFVNEVGLSPKLYARIVRFYNALENKLLHPDKRWVDITYEHGYFDQAHFIKEVKAFTTKTPEELFRDTPPPTEDFITKVEH